MVNLNKAVFLDRDGVLVKSIIKNRKGYAPRKLKDFKVYKDSSASVEKLNSLGFKIFVVTNQPDVRKKKISKRTLSKMHKILKKKVNIKKIYTCVHSLNEKCSCRKPMTGMLLKAAKTYKINLKKSYMVGDRESDILCGEKVGCKTIFINRNYDEKKPKYQIASVKNIKEAASCIIRDIKNGKIK